MVDGVLGVHELLVELSLSPRPDRVRVVDVRGHRNANPLRFETVGQRPAFTADFYHSILTTTWTRYFAGAGVIYLIANLLFALVYLAAPGSIANAREGSLEDAFFFSVQTMATIGYGTLTPATRFANVIVSLEALFGTVGVALMTGLTFAKFSRPTARVLFASSIVVGPRDGVPHVMFRLANERHNQIVEAKLRVVVLIEERTREGDTIRVPYEIKLVRDTSATFMLSWLAMHRIDEQSPFFGPDALARLQSQKAQIFLTMSGFDETTGSTIAARQNYALDDVVWNAAFVDILTVRDDGTRQIDYRRFHDTRPVGDTAADAPS